MQTFKRLWRIETSSGPSSNKNLRRGFTLIFMLFNDESKIQLFEKEQRFDFRFVAFQSAIRIAF
jgi:hypothetical protein